MPNIQPNIQNQLQAAVDRGTTVVEGMLRNIRDRYFRRTSEAVETIVFPPSDVSKNIVRGSFIPLLSLNEDLPIDNAVVFQFNPPKLEHNKVVNVGEINRTGFGYDLPFWVSGGAKTISFELFLDATAGSNYRNTNPKTSGFNSSTTGAYVNTNDIPNEYGPGLLYEIEKIEKLMYPVNREKRSLVNFTHGIPEVFKIKQFSTAPLVVFSYGNFVAVCYVIIEGRKDELFNRALNPIRTRLQVKLRIFETIIVDTNFRSANVQKLNSSL